jgi:hypothetical protein
LSSSVDASEAESPESFAAVVFVAVVDDAVPDNAVPGGAEFDAGFVLFASVAVGVVAAEVVGAFDAAGAGADAGAPEGVVEVVVLDEAGTGEFDDC